jgi:DNA-binding beta-propeller fold protein YncE
MLRPGFCGMLAVVVGCCCAAPAIAAPFVYWTYSQGDFGSIRRAELDGANPQEVVDNNQRMANIALDTVHDRMYWVDTKTDKIYRSTLDGQDIQAIVTVGPPTPFNSEGHGLAVDPLGGKIYWTNEEHDNKIFSANLDGSNVQTVLTVSGGDPFALALDLVNSKIYFSQGGPEPRSISVVNLDGSGPVQQLITDLITPAGIAVDPIGGKLYFTDATKNTINVANLDGTNQLTLVTLGDTGFPWGIALDTAAGQMYWAAGNGFVSRAKLDGSNVENLAQGPAFGIALDLRVIPEPSSAVLAFLGAVSMGLIVWRRRRRG